jgi:hypothetical protein
VNRPFPRLLSQRSDSGPKRRPSPSTQVQLQLKVAWETSAVTTTEFSPPISHRAQHASARQRTLQPKRAYVYFTRAQLPLTHASTKVPAGLVKTMSVPSSPLPASALLAILASCNVVNFFCSREENYIHTRQRKRQRETVTESQRQKKGESGRAGGQEGVDSFGGRGTGSRCEKRWSTEAILCQTTILS